MAFEGSSYGKTNVFMTLTTKDNCIHNNYMKILFKIVIIIFIININIDIYAISSESEEHLYNLISESSISSCSLDSLLLVIEKEVDLGNERILIPPKAILVFKTILR